MRFRSTLIGLIQLSHRLDKLIHTGTEQEIYIFLSALDTIKYFNKNEQNLKDSEVIIKQVEQYEVQKFGDSQFVVYGIIFILDNYDNYIV